MLKFRKLQLRNFRISTSFCYHFHTSSPLLQEIVESTSTESISFSKTPSTLGNPIIKKIPGLNISQFKPEYARESKINSMFEFDEEFISRYPTESVPKSLSLLFNHVNTPALLFRKSTLEFIRLVKSESEKPKSDQKYVLTGVAGIGKSALLMQTVAHFQKLNWIVIYIPQATYINSGFEPFTKRTDADLYDQPEYCRKILKSVLKFNGDAFSDINVKTTIELGNGDIETLDDLINHGIDHIGDSVKVVEILFTELSLENPDRPPVLVAIDQIDALYSETAYHDTESKIIDADKFSFMKVFIDLIKRTDLTRFVVTGATDATDNRLSTSLLKPLIQSETIPTINKDSTQLPLNAKKWDIPKQTAKGVLLPTKVTPFAEKLKSKKGVVPDGKYVKAVEVGVLDNAECTKLVRYYEDIGLDITTATLPKDEYIAKKKMLTGGIPLLLYKSCCDGFRITVSEPKKKPKKEE
ncbi:37S ribosomal protein S23 mitochondrial [Nowakowskiella sp. JEL0407]|nr:37S ribosomal protein S23 mitochondrial [Nowakowskiella sp. JEL0407]